MKILLIDDHKLFAFSISMILNQYKEVEKIDIINNINELEKIDILDYDIFLIDINLTNISEESGLEIAEKLIKNYKNIYVVILTGHVKFMYEQIANKIGARGFIDKNIEPIEFINILNIIYNGGTYFKNINNYIYEKLTITEINILNLVRKGKSIEEISKTVFISKRTVSNHLNNIYSKLGVNNKQEAVYNAEKLGYFLDFS